MFSSLWRMTEAEVCLPDLKGMLPPVIEVDGVAILFNLQ